VGALIRAKERGVDVHVIADRGAPCGRASGIEPLAAAAMEWQALQEQLKNSG